MRCGDAMLLQMGASRSLPSRLNVVGLWSRHVAWQLGVLGRPTRDLRGSGRGVSSSRAAVQARIERLCLMLHGRGIGHPVQMGRPGPEQAHKVVATVQRNVVTNLLAALVTFVM